MRFPSTILGTVALVGALASGAAAQEVALASVQVNVQVATRTSLKVSSELLQFDVTQPGGVATAAIDFTAGSRVAAGSDVVLTVEPLRAAEGPGGAADVETALSFTGEGQGLMAGRLAASQAAVIGRWNGSGLREGRIVFTLRADAAGSYSMPVRFVLSTP